MSLATEITLSSLELTRFFFAMVLLLFTAHSFGFLFYEAKLPRVIGEIFGGLILGPTFLGYFAPSAENWVFSAFPSEGALISVISYFGLVLLMFISGFEVQRSFSKQDRRIAISFLLGATVIPFIIGEGGQDWPAVAAATTLFVIPIVLFTVLLRRHLLRGITFGAVRK